MALVLLLVATTLPLRVVRAENDVVNQTMNSLYNSFLENLKSSIDRLLIGVKETFTYIVRRGLEVLIAIARASYVAIGLLGLTLWTTGISPYRGRHLIVGAIILAIVSEVACGLMS
ncbi:MAG: hypothetical protein QW701_05625 [Candidatus Nezhaarchaeales archaeon]